MRLKLELPTMERKHEAIQFIEEFLEYNSEINGTGGLDTSDYDKWLIKTLNSHNEVDVPEDKVGASTYFAIDENDKIVGMVNIRHWLNQFLIEHGYGHIGYSVRPLERRKGYATQILGLALEVCKTLGIKDVHVGCYANNIGSRKTIEHYNPTLLREFLDDEDELNREYIISMWYILHKILTRR